MSNFTPSVQTVSVTAGGTAQILVAAADVDNPRQSLMIQPQTEACLIQFGETAGLQATGSYTWAANPANNDTLDFNGVTFTTKTTVTDPAVEWARGATLAITLANALVVLNASVDADVSGATYSSSGAGIIDITYDAGGTDGNAYTLGTASGGNVTRSAATLEGGSNTVGGISLATGQLAIFNAAEFPQVKGTVYVVSATDAAYINYLVGQS